MVYALMQRPQPHYDHVDLALDCEVKDFHDVQTKCTRAVLGRAEPLYGVWDLKLEVSWSLASLFSTNMAIS